jgi:hypothetical protein
MAQTFDKFKITAPQVYFPEGGSYAVSTGIEYAKQYAVNTDNHSNSSTTFNIPVPSTNVIMDRRLILEMPVEIDFTCADNGERCLLPRRDGFRADPLSAICDNCRVDINGLGIDSRPRYLRRPLLNYASNETRAHLASITPCVPDRYSDYEDSVSATNSPFNGVQFEDYSGQSGRATYDWVITNNTNTTARVTAKLRCYVKVSPLLWGNADEQKGLANVSYCQVSFTWTNLYRLWSRDNDPDGLIGTPRPLSSMVVVLQKPTLYCTFFNHTLNTQIPSVVDYAHAQVIVANTNYSEDTPAYSPHPGGLQATTFRLDVVPSYMYLFVQDAVSSTDGDLNRSVGYTDACYSIQRVSVTFNNRDSRLNVASPSQLYQLSVQNGLNQSFINFNGRAQIIDDATTGKRVGLGGSIIKLDFSKDLGLDNGLLPGMSGTFQLSVQVDCTNESKRAVRPELIMLIINEGVLRVGSGTAGAWIGIMNAQDFMNIQELEGVPATPLHMYGGGFGSKAMEMLLSAVRNPEICKRATAKVCDLIGTGGAVVGGQMVGGQAKGGRSLKMR